MSEQENKDASTDHAMLAMRRNNETLKENLYHLEVSIKCARQSNWYGMEHFLHMFIDHERKRLAARLRLMEQYGVETYHNPFTEQEHALFTELLHLSIAFLNAANATQAQLVERFYEHPTGPNEHTVYQFRRDVSMCLHTYEWLVESFCKAEEEVLV